MDEGVFCTKKICCINVNKFSIINDVKEDEQMIIPMYHFNYIFIKYID